MNVISNELYLSNLIPKNGSIEWIEKNGQRFEVGSREYENHKYDLVHRYEIYMVGRVPILKIA